MFGGKYSNILTMILVILIVAIIGILIYFGYSVIHARNVTSNALSTVDEFEKVTKEIKKDTSSMKDTEEATENTTNNDDRDLLEELSNLKDEQEEAKATTEKEKVYMENYEVKGVIEIPKTGIKYPILESVTKKSLEIAVAIAYPENANLNEVGNVCIYGHNLRNGLFFSNNKKLSKGDEIYVTDSNGRKVIYVVYNIYETTPGDTDYMIRDVAGRREISLQTCTDDSSGRIIVWAAEKGSI